VPDEKMVVRLKWLNPSADADGGQAPRFQQWVFRQGQGIQAPVDETLIQPQNGETSTTLGGVTYHWRVSRYITVDVASQPGSLPLGMGAALLAASLFWRLAPRQQVWSVVRLHAVQEDGQEDELAEEQVTVRIRHKRNGAIRRLGQPDDTTWAALRAEIEDLQ
jgi:hypothetical protein